MLSSFTSPPSPFHFLPKLSPRDLAGTYRFLTSGLGLRTNTAQLSGRFEARNQVSEARSHSHNTASNKVCCHSTNARMAQGQSLAPRPASVAQRRRLFLLRRRRFSPTCNCSYGCGNSLSSGFRKSMKEGRNFAKSTYVRATAALSQDRPLHRLL